MHALILAIYIKMDIIGIIKGAPSNYFCMVATDAYMLHD